MEVTKGKTADLPASLRPTERDFPLASSLDFDKKEVQQAEVKEKKAFSVPARDRPGASYYGEIQEKGASRKEIEGVVEAVPASIGGNGGVDRNDRDEERRRLVELISRAAKDPSRCRELGRVLMFPS